MTILAGHIAESVIAYFISSLLSFYVAHFQQIGTEPDVNNNPNSEPNSQKSYFFKK